MSETIACDSLDAFALDTRDNLFPDELEGHACLRAVERAGLAGFRHVYFAVHEGDSLLAVVPAFVTDYRLDTTVRGGLRRVTESLTARFPHLLRIPMLALGSPGTERCRVTNAACSTSSSA